MRRAGTTALLFLLCVGCGGPQERQAGTAPQTARPRNLLLVTIDTLRADRVGAYGDRTARTPALDALAARGTRFTNAFAVTPITLPSHASIMTGRYPAGHGSRHNGMRIDGSVPTIAEALSKAGFSTAAFVGAFPLDRRYGLDRGFATYGDRLPRQLDGRPSNERPGQMVVDEAIAWLQQRKTAERFFLWVHLFEPHAPYGDARLGKPAAVRYGEEVAEADRQVQRLLNELGTRAAETLIAVVADHGEAFGEHGEIAHSIFVYDTTLRVPLILAGPGVPMRTVDMPASQLDLAPTVMRLLDAGPLDSDGIDLEPLLQGRDVAGRPLYAESFAPLLDFGWSPLRAVRADGWKYIAAPRPELYHVAADGAETTDLAVREPQRTSAMRTQVDRYSSDELKVARAPDRESAARLQALGYVSGSRQAGTRADPKDRRELAARIAEVTSGELHGEALEKTLRQILADDPKNPHANLRLGYVLLESQRCGEAMSKFRIAIAAHYPSSEPHLGLAECLASRRDHAAAATALREADAVEPGNPVVLANLGLMLSDSGDPSAAVDPLQRALTIDPDLHQARFALAVAFGRLGRRADARAQAEELLRRLPATAPQRQEVERLLAAVK